MKCHPGDRLAVVWASVLVALAAVAASAGCDTDNPWQTFADTAGSSLASGLKTIVDGAIDGAVAVIQAPSNSSQTLPNTAGT